MGFCLKYENEDAFDVISSDLRENISNGVQIDDAYNQISIGFEEDIDEENIPIVFSALKALCNMYFSKSTVEINNSDEFGLYNGNKHVTIKYPECAFQTVNQTSDFLFKIYRMFIKEISSKSIYRMLSVSYCQVTSRCKLANCLENWTLHRFIP